MTTSNERLSAAIADELFGPENAGRPVYTLPDSSALHRIAERAGLKGDPTDEVVAVVRSTLHLEDAGVAPFREQAAATAGHRTSSLETPPALPLLVVLSMAAERMQADGDLAAHNYYSRLHRMLRVPTERWPRVESDYRHHAAALWGSLNAWLEAWEGERGVPTAYALGSHEYIGLPMSQAVVRQHDRVGLHHVFTLEGMSPGLRLAPSDMEPAMDPYATATPSPLSSNLRRLWTIPAARERIVEAACLELEAWDGSGQLSITESRHSIGTRLLAFVRTFPRPSVEFNVLLPYGSGGADEVHFDAGGRRETVPSTPAPGNTTRLSSGVSIDPSSLVGDVLRGAVGRDGEHTFERRPRRVVPLHWDDMHGAYVEAERVALGDSTVVLARSDARTRVENHLNLHARPGWQERVDLPGVPDGWVFYDHVHVVSAPTGGATHLDLLPLIPRARTSLTMRGGFVLPGLLRKWSSLAPPEVVALAAGASELVVRVFEGARVDDRNLLIEARAEGELVVLSLQDRNLSDGEYLVALFVDGAARPVSTALLRLRSADSPQFSVDDADIRLVYSPAASVLWPLVAGPANWDTYVNGARLIGAVPDTASLSAAMDEYVPRAKAKQSAPPAVRVGVPATVDSCLATAMHRFQLPPVLPGQQPTRTVEGECVSCGLVKRFAGTPWAARKRDEETGKEARTVEVPAVADVERPGFEVAFDAMNHVGHGSGATFERIAAQVEGSGLFADTFLRRQEVVGNLDVGRDEWLEVAEWAVNSATLVPIDTERWVLVGARSRALLNELRLTLGDEFQVRTAVDAQLSRIEVAGPQNAMAARDTALATIGVIALPESPALGIARSLPPLSQLAAGLKRLAVPTSRSTEKWSTDLARWEPSASVAGVGAYRLRDFRSTYVVRSRDDLASGTVGIGNAQLVKHIANMWAGKALVGYHTKSSSVLAPLGADLPGLFGRALSICSGRAPREIVEQRVVQYASVPRNIANTVLSRLTE